MVLGKKFLNDFYWHYSLTAEQPDNVKQQIQFAEKTINIKAGIDYNVIRYSEENDNLSFLNYPNFFDLPFPELAISWKFRLSSKKINKRNYKNSLNPPIIHRKELFIHQNHSRQKEYQSLTKMAEALGLFENKIQIGYKQPWYSLIHSIGYQVEDHQIIPIGNCNSGVNSNSNETILDSENRIEPHKTAISRSNLSAPMQFLARYGFLSGEYNIFDYGCGKGDDLHNLHQNGIDAKGWDPHYAPNNPKITSDIVNIGFVLNVIENQFERQQALQGAFTLADKLLVVSVMLYHQSSHKGERYKDGYISSRNTFQKYYSQAEIKEYIDKTLKVESIPVAPGIFFVFSDQYLEQEYLQNKQCSQSNYLRLVKRNKPTQYSKLGFSIREKRKKELYELYQKTIEPLKIQWIQLGRQPDKSEIENIITITEVFGTYNKAIKFLISNIDVDILEQARVHRIDDILTYLAFQTFTKRTAFSHMGKSLQRDIKTFFGDYTRATAIAKKLIYELGDISVIEEACNKATEDGLGYYDEKDRSLYFPAELLERLPVILRLYVACGVIIFGDVGTVDLIKIHVDSGKLSLMKFDNFLESPLPLLQERVKINFRLQEFDVFEYGGDYPPTYLYLKSKYINEEFPHYAEQLVFDEALQLLQKFDNTPLFDFSGYGPSTDVFMQKLSDERLAIENFDLISSKTIPSLEDKCGQHFVFRDFIECGDTWKALHEKENINNIPQQADTYNALHTLAKEILDPIIDYFGMIELTYGFSSADLSKLIPGRIAPKLDQHASYELNRMKKPICSRLGAACDFIVAYENMLEVAQWVVQNTHFDRLYFYGNDKPIHISIGPEQKSEIVLMKPGKARLIPSVVNKNKFLQIV